MKTNGLIRDEVLKPEATVVLGITLDAKLQWSTFIYKLIKQLSSEAYAVCNLTDIETFRLVYFT